MIDYKELLSRLFIEAEHLDNKRRRLQDFLDSDAVSGIEQKHLHLLHSQAASMRAYSLTLHHRILLIQERTNTGE